ncbi:hypothetical protein [Paenarthrobacter ureafaciens]|nr:hypothetical protein [Paenarthrobacter ureafaciens]AOY73847.1 hypothetical protein ARZXY2_4348 [Arthrobacter sp. ZXY-2]
MKASEAFTLLTVPAWNHALGKLIGFWTRPGHSALGASGPKKGMYQTTT